MKLKHNIIGLSLLLSATFNNSVNAQSRDLQNFRTPGLSGINQFETQKDSTSQFEQVKVRLGGDFSFQFQALEHSTGSDDTLMNLGKNFNLPTANLNLDVQLADGVRMSMVTYLSSRHHPEAWVKGGYIQVDKLDFIKDGFLDKVMNIITIKAGLDEINYGDAHFRRSDNARTIYNPFVGNYLMDAFTTEAFGEIYAQKNGVLAMIGVSNGNLNQTVAIGSKEPKPSLYAKLGYDNELNEDLRLRLTGSMYSSLGYDNGQYLYHGDRTGSRYYNVMQGQNAGDNFRSGRFSPGFYKFTAIQLNPFVSFKGLEFFGIYEQVNGDQNETAEGGAYTQIGTELIYRIGGENKYFIGGRYNSVNGKDNENADEKSISRINVGGGWFMTENVMVKAEYVDQNYSGKGWESTLFEDGNFKGFVVEATISF